MFEVTQGKGFQITFANGWLVSVQWGPDNYCDHPKNEDRRVAAVFHARGKIASRKADTAEIAVWHTDLSVIGCARFGQLRVGERDTVRGYVTADDVARVLYLVMWHSDSDGDALATAIRELFTDEEAD